MHKILLPLGLAVLFSCPAISETLAVSPPAQQNGPPSASPPPAKTWTLAASIRRAGEIAPELRAARADVAARAAALAQAGAWPNPTVDVRADNRLQNETGSAGTNVTQIALSQPLPLRRLARQRAVAAANLESARARLHYRSLLLERRVAQAFLALQLAEARYRLADERRHLVAQSAGTPRKHKSDRLVRYLTPLERQRLSILNEEASQAVAAAQRERQNALVDFRSLLALPDGTAVELTAPVLPPEPMALDKYMRVLDTHPALAAVRKEAEAAQAGIALAESERYADPAISLYRERDYYASGRRDVSGIGISVQIPLWNDGGSVVAKARAEAGQAQAQVASVRRDARSRLKRAFVSLQRLVAQAGELHDTLLDTSHEMYLLTRKGFAAGELNVLALVDASNTYFDARARYLELQHQAALAVADLRLASGVSLLDSRKEVQP